MTTGDESMLPRDHDDAQGDASPMISSVQTRAIADARGAYVVGNLKGLITAMSKVQQLRFKEALIQQASFCLHPYILEGSPESECLELIRHSVADSNFSTNYEHKQEVSRQRVNVGSNFR
jgi:hypothetical protein